MTGSDVAWVLVLGAAVVATAWGLVHLVPTLRDAVAAPTPREREDARRMLLSAGLIAGVLVMLILQGTSR